MPTYEYQCSRCTTTIEQRRPIGDDRPGPWCGDCCVEMTRKFSTPALHFKGSGFYKTDNR